MSFLKQQVYKLFVVVALLAAIALPASAQEVKIGVVNIPALMQRAPQTQAAMDALQEEFAPRQREILARQKEYEELGTKFQKDAAVMGETERRNMEKELRDLQREVTRLQNEFQEDLNLRQNEEMSNLQVSLLQEIQAYAAQEGYDLLVGDGVLYASGAVNITEQVLRAVEANFQALNAAP
ncbi:MAG: OmpH family outer membrane protein [Woeseiaceae bacterium]|nr:OmpH family outer membrane protein [Woeseiaceae bacterium]NIP19718.1 OmpH family outer membrane protein [Woeseiaceae bacterium]NIS89835.1 OmpH family outer membrane protein [Woeseiaceae bacterium]